MRVYFINLTGVWPGRPKVISYDKHDFLLTALREFLLFSLHGAENCRNFFFLVLATRKTAENLFFGSRDAENSGNFYFLLLAARRGPGILFFSPRGTENCENFYFSSSATSRKPKSLFRPLNNPITSVFCPQLFPNCI